MNHLLIYFLIFAGQLVQNAISTFRYALIARGERLLNTVMCFFQSVIGMACSAFALKSLFEDPLQGAIYIISAAIGNYVGVKLEEILALGQNILTVIVSDENGKEITENLRSKNYAVTVLEGKGIKAKKAVLMIAVNRRKERKLMKEILSKDSAAVIINESVSTVGGYY